MTEKVLAYPRGPVGDYDGVTQDYGWDCGPASCSIILAALGIDKTEDWLIGQIGTTVDGTNSAECCLPVLNSLTHGAYQAVWLSREPLTQAQIEKLWADLTLSINVNGRGVLLNFEAPPGRGPKGTRGSTSPPYPTRSTTYHFTAAMGTADDGPGGRHVWVADPAGFGGITGYWISLEQCATLIVPHAYAYSSTPAPAPAPKPVVAPTERLDRMWIEWNAIEFGDPDAVAVIVGAAKAGDPRAMMALAKLEQTNPAALQRFINRKAVAA